MLVNGPPNGGILAAVFGQWNDDDNPDDILQAEGVNIALPPLTSGFGRRVGHAVARESLVSAAFPRGPPDCLIKLCIDRESVPVRPQW